MVLESYLTVTITLLVILAHGIWIAHSLNNKHDKTKAKEEEGKNS